MRPSRIRTSTGQSWKLDPKVVSRTALRSNSSGFPDSCAAEIGVGGNKFEEVTMCEERKGCLGCVEARGVL